MKWLQLISKVQFKFPDIKCLQLLSVSFKAMCYRLHMVITLGENVPFPKCYHCSGYTCQRNCVEGSSAKVVIEIGNKYTWVITPFFGLRRHFSMFGIPRYNNKTHVEQTQTQNIPSSSTRSKPETKSLAKRLKLLKLSELATAKIPRPSGPFCVFCNPVKLYREKRRLVTHQNDPICYTRPNPIYQKLINGYCTDTVEVLGIPNVDIVSPAEALLCEGTFPVLKTFIDHLFHQMGLTTTLRKPNTVLMFCEPLAMQPTLRKQLLHYLFQEVKVARYSHLLILFKIYLLYGIYPANIITLLRIYILKCTQRYIKKIFKIRIKKEYANSYGTCILCINISYLYYISLL